MNTFIIIISTLFVLSFIALVVVSIIVLYQIKNTAKEAEEILKKINKNLDNVTYTTEQFKNVITSSIPIMFSLSSIVVSNLLKLIGNLFKGKKQ